MRPLAPVRFLPLAACCALALVSACASTSGDSTAKYAERTAMEAQSDVILPPGWTEADMQACMVAGTPGPMHQKLAASVGTWTGTSTMWMAPGTEPMTSPCTMTVSTIMDGRYTKTKFEGDMPGMGPFQGMGINGFDNVTQEHVSVWIDNHSTGIMTGKGEMSPDGSTLTWTYTYNCPIRKRPVEMREIDRTTGDGRMTLEMFGQDPKTGVEYRMMQIDLARK